MISLEKTNSYCEPKYFRLKKILLNDIKKGKYQPNSKVPSETEFKKMYDISTITVRQAIRELVNEGVVYTVQGKGCFVVDNEKNNGKNINGENNRNVFLPYQMNRIMFIFPDVLNEFYTNILRGIIDVVQPHDYSLDIHSLNYGSGNIYENEMKLLAKCLERPVAGLVFIPYFCDRQYAHLFQLRKKNIPVVFADRRVKDYDFDFVASDHFEAAKQGVNYLIKKGHRRIAFAERYKTVSSSKGIYEGYEQALKDNGIKVDNKLIYLVKDPNNYIPNSRDAINLIKDFLLSEKGKYTAVFCHCDIIATICYRILKDIGLSVPGDVSLMSAGDSHAMENNEVPVTAVKHDVYNMGYCAGKMLLKRIERKPENSNMPAEEILLKTKIVARESVEKLKKNKQ